MNNPALLICFAGVGIAAWFAGRTEVNRLHRAAEIARQSLAQATLQLRSASEHLSGSQGELARVTEATARSRLSLQGMMTPTPPKPFDTPDPDREGIWPTNQPYFHLRKDLLTVIGYESFDPTGDLSDAVAFLFGMTPSEHFAATSAWRDYRRRFQELEVTMAERIPNQAGVDTTDHREVAYRLPSLTQQVEGLRAGLKEELTAHLGEQRTALLLDHLSSELANESPPHARTLVYVADRGTDGVVTHRLQVRTETGTIFSPMSHAAFPPDETHPVWPYRHLFGTEPLIRVPAQRHSPGPE